MRMNILHQVRSERVKMHKNGHEKSAPDEAGAERFFESNQSMSMTDGS